MLEGGVGWWEVWEGAGHENHEMREWGGENWEGVGGIQAAIFGVESAVLMESGSVLCVIV